MEGIELITAALAAGAAAGITGTTSEAIRDAYGALRGRLSALLAGPNAGMTLKALDTEADPAVLAERLSEDLLGSGAVADEQVLDAAHRLLELTRAGASTTFVVGTNNGAVGEFRAPVTFHAPLPPSSPGTA
ncbi:hypothetical protein ACTMS0_26665 [Micromonospora sp. H33]|uniref:hypothetical protein n=1 Tax=Micromonospora sp. H33 TaxID=3452215 RepID=UPI003F8C3498